MTDLRGLYGKFIVRRVDGSDASGGKHDGCNYFVLDMNHDPHAIPALRAYAKSCAEERPTLSRDLQAIADGNKLMVERPSVDLYRKAAASPLEPREERQAIEERADRWLKSCRLAKGSSGLEDDERTSIGRALRRILGSCSDPVPTLMKFIAALQGAEAGPREEKA